MGDLFLTIMYMCMYTYWNISLIGMLWVSCWPIEFYLPQGLDGAGSTTLTLRSVDECVMPPGLTELHNYIKQPVQSTAVYGLYTI